MTVVTKLSLFQLVFTLIFASVLTLIWGKLHGASALLGGLICVFANLFFAGKLFVAKQVSEPKKILRQFYRSEALKIVFTLVLFILVFKLIKIEFMSFITAYTLTALLNLICLPWLK
jgi:ATP synthase protein I